MRLINEATKEKLRGGFYTPNHIAAFILKWGFNGDQQFTVLEPSCGDGVFLDEIKNGKFNYKAITAVEIDPDKAEKAKKLLLPNTTIITSDFHNFFLETSSRFDLIIGNPPYIRYQYFDKDQQAAAAEIFNQADLKYSKLTNAWVSFVIGSSLLLNECGKIGFVVPAELLQVSYAQPLREFLAHFYNKINIISFEKLVFPQIQQEVLLLLCEKNQSGDHLIEHIELRDAQELNNLDVGRLKSPKKKIDFKSNKWTFYFLDQDEIDFIEYLQESGIVSELREYATVEVGITTGSNPFFTVPLSTVEEYRLERFSNPLVGRSVQVPGVIFTHDDWIINRDNEKKAHLLVFPSIKELTKENGALEYIKWGEDQGIHNGYKCRIRDEWQIVPSIRISEALFIRRNNLYPKLIINTAKAYTTDTMHRVTCRDGVNIEALTASYYNSISFAFAEICGRSYGGGVLELMPNEAENILVPYKEDNADLLKTIDAMIRENQSIKDILSITNKKILQDNLGFSAKDIEMATRIWDKLSSRRLNRA
jgi:adenine-specific DNA-methyltransferase